jgi:F420-dependent oxidoreductase-like protein
MPASHPVRLGIKLSPQNVTIEELRAVWRLGDEAGFDHVWGFDHFNPIFSDPKGPIYEGWTLMAAMAVEIKRARIGLMVTGNTYRHPGVLAKIAVTVDHLSGGRLEFGLGAAWAEIEHTMLGLPFHTVGRRIRAMNEALHVCRKLWTEDDVNFDGRYYQLTDATHNPKPLQKPYPPIWIGGSGEKLTLRFTAEHADVWNAAGGDTEMLKHKSAVLDRHCEDIGRDPAEIRRSVQVRFDPKDPGATVGQLEQAIELGFTENVVYVAPPDPVAAAEVAATEVLSRISR